MIGSSSYATEVTGEGYGKTSEQARKQALAALSEAISVEIISDFQSVTTHEGDESSRSQIRAQSNLPILGASIDTIKKRVEYYSQATLTSAQLRLYNSKIKKLLQKIAQISQQLSLKKMSRQQKYTILTQTLTHLDQLSKYQTVAYVLGSNKTETPAITKTSVESQLISLGTEADNLAFAAEILTQKLNNKKIMISPATVTGSHEITSMSRILRDNIAARLNTTQEHEKAEYFFKGHYEILKKGIHVTYQLTDAEGNTKTTRTVKLSPKAYRNMNYKPRTSEFDRLLHQGIVVSNDFKVSINTNRGNENLLFTEEEEVELFVKLNRSGYFYIVSHVSKDTEQQSYLLELTEAPSPRKFVKFVNADDANRWISLGEFVVSKPFGVESLQIIASNKDLAGALPPFRYDNDTELYMAFSGKPGEAVIRTRGLRPKKSKAKNIKSAEAVLMMSTFSK